MFSFIKKKDKNQQNISFEEETSFNLINNFDEDAYCEANPDIKEGIEKGNFRNVKHHLETFGFDEIKRGLRKFHKDFEVFSENKYKESFSDIDKAIKDGYFINAFEHFCLNGYEEILRKERSWSTIYNNNNVILNESEYVDIAARLDVDLRGLNPDQLHIYNILVKQKIDWTGYEESNNLNKTIDNPLLHYIHHWQDLLPILPNVFDTRLYVELYPDIMASNVNPLYHYMLHGKKEGRLGYFEIDNYLEEGKIEYNKSYETIIIANHESSATGAPLLGLNIASSFAKKYNVVQIILKKSKLNDQFLEACECAITDIKGEELVKHALSHFIKNRKISCVICNSVEAYDVLKSASELGMPTISLVHEFANYTRPIGKLSHTVFYADKVIIPATIVKESLYEELKLTANIKDKLRNLVVLPQGKLPMIPESNGVNLSIETLNKSLEISQSKNTKIIVGAGFVQIRKGVDLFLSMATYIKQRYNGTCKFIWVGDGYDPINDLDYSVWLEKQLKSSGLNDDFIFLGHQKNLDNVLAIADVFALTSRLDPFPNVVVDALESDVHVSCFSDGTGSAEFLLKNKANCTVVDSFDVSLMADKVINYLKSSKLENIGVNKKLVQKKLNFNEYMKELQKYIDIVIKNNKINNTIVDKLLDTQEFNSDFFSFKKTPYEACKFYVNNTQKGIYLYNPKPGFSDKKWLNDKGMNKFYSVPLYEAMKKKNTKTHDVQIVPYKTTEEIDFFYAVHLHLFYIELAEEFAEYFKNLPGKYDILITTVSKDDNEKIYDIFSKCGANDVKIVYVKNIGRDMAPLLFDLKNVMRDSDYEIIGHFHTKKSLDNNEELGNRWRHYLMKNLIGDHQVAKCVLNLFNDPKIGLVFSEDAHVVDIGENKKYINDLCTMMNLKEIKETVVFPLGNMFWARKDAVKELFMLDKTKILQEEPLPYDGSYMHALERVLPYVVEKNLYQYKTVYKKDTRW